MLRTPRSPRGPRSRSGRPARRRGARARPPPRGRPHRDGREPTRARAGPVPGPRCPSRWLTRFLSPPGQPDASLEDRDRPPDGQVQGPGPGSQSPLSRSSSTLASSPSGPRLTSRSPGVWMRRPTIRSREVPSGPRLLGEPQLGGQALVLARETKARLRILKAPPSAWRIVSRDTCSSPRERSVTRTNLVPRSGPGPAVAARCTPPLPPRSGRVQSRRKGGQIGPSDRLRLADPSRIDPRTRGRSSAEHLLGATPLERPVGAAGEALGPPARRSAPARALGVWRGAAH